MQRPQGTDLDAPVVRGVAEFHKVDQNQTTWMGFYDERGQTQGELTATRDDGHSSGGVVLRSASGDFAEWHRRAAHEPPFAEGDVVGITTDGLSRRTKGVAQVAIISRRAIVEGSLPSARERSNFDRVAYAGHVPVKLIGGVKKGCFVVPSGAEDGTAVAASSQDPRVKLGRALEAIEPKWASSN